MKGVLTLIAALMVSTGCSGSSTQEESNSSRSASSGSPLTFTLDGLTVRIDHTNMEASDECPAILLLNAGGNIMDQKPLCKIDIAGYRRFDAREDFAFIGFGNYRLEDNFLVYDIDLALRQGSAFIAECRLPITDERLGNPECKELDS